MAAPTPAPEPEPVHLTVDELASSTGTTTRHVRSLQTLGVLPRPELRGRTGLYGAAHRERLQAVLRLQEEGFSLESLRILLDAHAAGHSLASVLGLPETDHAEGGGAAGGAADREVDEVEDAASLYGFAELQRATYGRHRGEQPPLSVVPTTVWDQSRAS